MSDVRPAPKNKPVDSWDVLAVALAAAIFIAWVFVVHGVYVGGAALALGSGSLLGNVGRKLSRRR